MLSSPIYFMSCTFFVFFFIGIASSTFHNDLNKEEHYTNYVSEENPVKVTLRISAVLKSNDYYDKYEAAVLK